MGSGVGAACSRSTLSPEGFQFDLSPVGRIGGKGWRAGGPGSRQTGGSFCLPAKTWWGTETKLLLSLRLIFVHGDNEECFQVDVKISYFTLTIFLLFCLFNSQTLATLSFLILLTRNLITSSAVVTDPTTLKARGVSVGRTVTGTRLRCVVVFEYSSSLPHASPWTLGVRPRREGGRK